MNLRIFFGVIVFFLFIVIAFLGFGRETNIESNPMFVSAFKMASSSSEPLDVGFAANASSTRSLPSSIVTIVSKQTDLASSSSDKQVSTDVAPKFTLPEATRLDLKLVAKSFINQETQAKINKTMANEGEFFEVPRGILEQLQESSDVAFEYNGRSLIGKVTYLDAHPFPDQDGRTVEISFGNSAELKVYTEKGLVRGSLRDNGQLFQVEGFENEWVIMDFYTYKRLNNALIND